MSTRRRLDHEQVVAAAEEIVDELGWDNLTMAALASRLKTKAPSLYNHVDGLEDLRREVQARTVQLLGRELVGATMGRAGREGFFAVARAYRAFVLRYPERYLGMMRVPIDEDKFATAAEDTNQALLAVVRSYGVAEDDVARVQVAAFAAIHGAVSLEASGFLGDFIDHDELFETVVEAVEHQLASAPRDKVA